jgi:hypothetical protein
VLRSFCTVTAEVASSSLVVPAILFKHFQRIGESALGSDRVHREDPAYPFCSTCFTSLLCAKRFSPMFACAYRSRVIRLLA